MDATTLTPVVSLTGTRTHATAEPDPCRRTTVRTLCGRTLAVVAAWSPGTYDHHARNTVVGHDPGACVRCAEVAGVRHLFREGAPY